MTDHGTEKKAEFTADTVVAKAIRADPEVVERLIELSPHFAKLRNPVLRKVMARLVTFEDAARIADVPVEAVLAAANGAQSAPAAAPATAETPPMAEPPEWVSAAGEDRITRFDARPVLERGDEPFAEIMRLTAPLAAGDIFIIDAPFDPAPLRRVLGRKGFTAYGREIADDHWQVVFVREDGSKEPDGADDSRAAESRAEIWKQDDIPHIDVRGLEAPQPMLSILRLIEAPDTGDMVIVHHEREPLFLYPELEERGWRHEIVEENDAGIILRLKRGEQ